MPNERSDPATPSVPEPGPLPAPSFDEPARDAPHVVEAPQRDEEYF